jgi:hypothetical protein
MTAESDLREIESACEEITHHGAPAIRGMNYMTTARGKHVLTSIVRLSTELIETRSTMKWEREISDKLVDSLRDDNQRLTDALLEATCNSSRNKG